MSTVTYVSYVCFIKSKARNPEATKTRILNAAELLFATHGFRGVSLRELTQSAHVNLAAVNYHFGDMKTVYREVLLRRLRPLNALRLSLLAEACAGHGESVPALETIIQALARPLFDLHRAPAAGGRAFLQILSRALSEPMLLSQELLAEEYHPALTRFAQAIRRHAPQLAPEEFMWRLSFVVGALHHTLATLHQMSVLTRGLCRSEDHDGALVRFIAHAAASFRAPPTIN